MHFDVGQRGIGESQQGDEESQQMGLDVQSSGGIAPGSLALTNPAKLQMPTHTIPM